MMGRCKLCGETKPLIDAHIVPRGFYPKLPSGEPHYLLTTDGKRPSRSWTGLYDKNLLCGDCDRTIGVFDQYASELLLPWPTRDALLRESDGLIAKGGDTHYAGYKLFPDVNKLQRFAASLIWRAANSGRKEFEIAPRNSFVRKAEMLLHTGDPGHYLGVFARRLDNRMLGRFVARPVHQEGDFGESFEFCMSGVMVSIMEDPPPGMSPIVLGTADEWWVKFEAFWGSLYELAMRDAQESAHKIPGRKAKNG